MGYGYYTREIDGVERRMGYNIPCLCDFPSCIVLIDRGLAYLCGQHPGETEFGCGRYFCGKHMGYRRYGRGKHAVRIQNCDRCRRGRPAYPMKAETDLAWSWGQLSEGLRQFDHLYQTVREVLATAEHKGLSSDVQEITLPRSELIVLRQMFKGIKA